MSEHYDEGVRGLREAPVPEQWDDILARATGSRPTRGSDGLSGFDRSGPGRRWPLVMAIAASVAIVASVVVLATRDDPDVSTGTPADPSSTADTGASTTDSAPATTTTAGGATTTASGAALPNEVVDIESYPVSACRGLQFTATDPPQGVDGAMQAVAIDDPRVPSAAHGNVTGAFPSTTPTRSVFVVAGWPGLQDDVGSYVEGPFPRVQSWIAPYDEGWLAEIAAPASAEIYCPFTLIGLGLTETDFRQFLSGLALEG